MQTKPLLLIAEDDPDDQFFIQEAIRVACPPEIETHFVWDGVELIDYLYEKVNSDSPVPNLVLLDLNLPRTDGRAVLREIKADPALADVRVVVLTTSENPADYKYCQQYGVVGYYGKPSSVSELRKIIGDLCMDI